MIWRRAREPLDALVAELKREGRDGRLRLLESLPRREPAYAEPAPPLPPALRAALRAGGVERLYAHQAELLAQTRAGADVALVAPTAGGKTLAFALAVCERWLADRGARAICVYPTNALIHDQERALHALLDRLPAGPRVATLTGATPIEERRALRTRPPAILLTNPEMLHLSLAGAQAGWAGLLAGLAFVVLDEAHAYRGAFGAHMALTTRRLLRAAASYGAEPRLIVCSATVGNPAELAGQLAGREFVVVDGEGGATGARSFAVWRSEASKTESPGLEAEAAWLFAASVKGGLGTILFLPSRRGVERVAARARAMVGPKLAGLVAPYRGGYTPEQRRLLEQKLREGRLRGIVATNALELGIDVGRLSVAICAGFPGSRTSLWQQLGRAGRAAAPSLGVFIAASNRATDGYYAEHPRALLARPFEDAVIDLANPAIVAQHLVCAAAEAPLRQGELARFGPQAASASAEAVRAGALLRRGDLLYPVDRAPHGGVALRGAGRGYELRCAGVSLGSLSEEQVGREAYPGATYLHDGARYRVFALDSERRQVEVTPDPDAPDTAPIIHTSIGLAQTVAQATAVAVTARRTTAGFFTLARGRKRSQTSLPEPVVLELHSRGFWLALPDHQRWPVGADGPARLAAMHALEHVVPVAAAIALACDPRDLVLTAVLEHRQTAGDALVVYDAVQGGSGLAERVARQLRGVLAVAAELVGDCPCRRGCPRCVLAGACWREHRGDEKALALGLLLALTA